MKFGIFYELQLPRPWGPDSEFQLYQDALAQLELADALGYDYAWEVEHHFLEEYSHSSAPEVFLAAASQRTKRIRLGHGIFQLTTNHPAKVAEKVAALDLCLANSPTFFKIGGVYFSSRDLNSSSETHFSPKEILAGSGYFNAEPFVPLIL